MGVAAIMTLMYWTWPHGYGEICMYTHNTLCCTTSACGQWLHVAVHCSFWSISRDGYFFTHYEVYSTVHTVVAVLGSVLEKSVFLVPLISQHWSKVKTSGGRPSARMYHAACCIAGPLTEQPHPLLIVICGRAVGLVALSDVWVLDVAQGLWSQVLHVCISVVGLTMYIIHVCQ